MKLEWTTRFMLFIAEIPNDGDVGNHERHDTGANRESFRSRERVSITENARAKGGIGDSPVRWSAGLGRFRGNDVRVRAFPARTFDHDSHRQECLRAILTDETPVPPTVGRKIASPTPSRCGRAIPISPVPRVELQSGRGAACGRAAQESWHSLVASCRQSRSVLRCGPPSQSLLRGGLRRCAV